MVIAAAADVLSIKMAVSNKRCVVGPAVALALSPLCVHSAAPYLGSSCLPHVICLATWCMLPILIHYRVVWREECEHSQRRGIPDAQIAVLRLSRAAAADPTTSPADPAPAPLSAGLASTAAVVSADVTMDFRAGCPAFLVGELCVAGGTSSTSSYSASSSISCGATFDAKPPQTVVSMLRVPALTDSIAVLPETLTQVNCDKGRARGGWGLRDGEEQGKEVGL